MEVRILLFIGNGVSGELLEAIAAARNIPIDRLQLFEGRPIRNLYVEGFCGGGHSYRGSGFAAGEVHVPLAHQSILSSVLLAAAVARGALGLNPPGASATRIDLMRPHVSETAPCQDGRGICICQDSDYRDIYEEKYHFSLSAGSAST
jgi:hypothetical protein